MPESESESALAHSFQLIEHADGVAQIVGGRFDGEDLVISDVVLWDGSEGEEGHVKVRIVFRPTDAVSFGEALMRLGTSA